MPGHSYSKHIVTSSGIGGNFIKLLFRWKASVYKLIFKEFLLYILSWYAVCLIYKFGLPEEQKKIFDDISKGVEKYSSKVPLAWVLGFYVTIVYNRWWDQYMNIPLTPTLSFRVAANIYGKDDDDANQIRQIRRTILRYANLTILLTFKKLSPVIKDKYPTLDSFIEQGVLTEEEKRILGKQALEVEEWKEVDKTFFQKSYDNEVNGKSEKINLEKDHKEVSQKSSNEKDLYPDYFLPMVWATRIVREARVNGQIRSDYAMNEIMDEIISLRSSCSKLIRYDARCVPLVYTQVVTIAVHSYFVSTVFGRQYRQEDRDLHFPMFTVLEFILYVGWLKVAETIVNPFGDDADDFKLHDISTANRRVGYLIVDNDEISEQPSLIQDKHWNIASKGSQENTTL